MQSEPLSVILIPAVRAAGRKWSVTKIPAHIGINPIMLYDGKIQSLSPPYCVNFRHCLHSLRSRSDVTYGEDFLSGNLISAATPLR